MSDNTTRKQPIHHLALDMFEHLIQKKKSQHNITEQDKLIYKFAQLQLERIRELLSEGIITDYQVSEMLLDHKQADKILKDL